MTRRNYERHQIDKLVRWDADWYKELTDDDCIVCLTERQVYLLGQSIGQINWVRTRWVGDISDLDFDAIASETKYRLEERMTCELLTTLSAQITALQAQITTLQTQVAQQSVTINFGDVLNDILDPARFDEALGGDTGCDNDVLWGGVSALVDYIHNNNLQLLNEFEQTVGNEVETLATAVSGTPIVGYFPADEILLYASNLIDNVKDEYETITDTDFLNSVKCDLFCLVSGDNPCNITLNVLLNWLNSHNVLTIDTAVTRIADIFQALTVGSFISDEAFWSISAWQIVITASGERFLSANGLNNYESYLATGYNSPDEDWSILCTDCPAQYCTQFGNGFDFDQWTDQAALTPSRPFGNRVGDTWVSEFGGAVVGIPDDERLYMHYATPNGDPYHCATIDTTYDFDGTLGAPHSFSVTFRNNGSVTYTASGNVLSGTGNVSHLEPNATFDEILLAWGVTSSVDGDCEIICQQVTITGNGDSPDGASNC